MYVPEGWRKGVLSDLATLFSGFAFKSLDQKDSGVRWLKIANVGFGEIKWEDESFLPEDYADKYARYLLKESDIVVAMTRPTLNGKLKIAKVGKNDTSLLNQRVARLDCNLNVDKEFIYHIFRSDYTAYKINESLKGTDPPNLSVKVLEDIAIIIPPLAEQEKIAEILSTWDRAIEQTERLKTNAEMHKKALMQQLLTGKKRFPEFEGEWEKIRLGDYAKIQSGGTPRTTIAEYYDNGKIPWVSISDMTAYGKYINKTDRNITDKGLENSSAKLYPQGTVLYAMYASIGEVSIASVDLTSSQAILGIQPDPEVINNHYLYFYLKSLQEKIILMGQQGTQSNLNAGMVKGFRLNLPSLEEQQKIASVLNTADREIELLTQKIEHLKSEKRALMQQLLTGKRRVKVDG